jgi:hypothetical protein
MIVIPMKKLITILFFFSAFVSNAKEPFFRGNKSYVAPEIPATLITTVTLEPFGLSEKYL